MCLPRPPNNWTDNCQIQRWQCAVKTVKNKWVIVAALTLKTTSKHSCVLWCVLFSGLWKHTLPIESVTCCSQTGSHHIHFIYRNKQYIWENWLGLWRYESRSAWAAWKEESAEVIFMTGSRVRGQGSITCASCHRASWENSWMFVQLTYPVSLSLTLSLSPKPTICWTWHDKLMTTWHIVSRLARCRLTLHKKSWVRHGFNL